MWLPLYFQWVLAQDFTVVSLRHLWSAKFAASTGTVYYDFHHPNLLHCPLFILANK